MVSSVLLCHRQIIINQIACFFIVDGPDGTPPFWGLCKLLNPSARQAHNKWNGEQGSNLVASPSHLLFLCLLTRINFFCLISLLVFSPRHREVSFTIELTDFDFDLLIGFRFVIFFTEILSLIKFCVLIFFTKDSVTGIFGQLSSSFEWLNISSKVLSVFLRRARLTKTRFHKEKTVCRQNVQTFNLETYNHNTMSLFRLPWILQAHLSGIKSPQRVDCY